MSVIDLTLTAPGEPHLAGLIGELTTRAALSCGHGDTQATAFGEDVARAVDAACRAATSAGRVTCTVSRDAGPLEVVITSAGQSRTLTLA
jgi:hypothetical protein